MEYLNITDFITGLAIGVTLSSLLYIANKIDKNIISKQSNRIRLLNALLKIIFITSFLVPLIIIIILFVYTEKVDKHFIAGVLVNLLCILFFIGRYFYLKLKDEK